MSEHAGKLRIERSGVEISTIRLVSEEHRIGIVRPCLGERLLVLEVGDPPVAKLLPKRPTVLVAARP